MQLSSKNVSFPIQSHRRQCPCSQNVGSQSIKLNLKPPENLLMIFYQILTMFMLAYKQQNNIYNLKFYFDN